MSEKCVRHGWIVSKLIEDIDDTELVLTEDVETALVQVINEVERQRQQEAMLEQPPAYDPMSKGAVEKAVDQGSQNRTGKKDRKEKRDT